MLVIITYSIYLLAKGTYMGGQIQSCLAANKNLSKSIRAKNPLQRHALDMDTITVICLRYQ